MDTDPADRRRDAALVVASVQQPEVFGALFDRHAEAVVQFFYRRTGCAQTAADLMAETFAAAFSSRKRFRDTGAPLVGPQSSLAERAALVEELVDSGFAHILEGDTEMFVTPTWGRSAVAPVVTVVRTSSAWPPAAESFVVGVPADPSEATNPRIERIPLPRSAIPTPVPAPGSVLYPGSEVVVPATPVEGGARAHFGEREVPVAVDPESMTMTVTVPQSARGDVAVTLASATPELPAAWGYGYRILDAPTLVVDPPAGWDVERSGVYAPVGTGESLTAAKVPFDPQRPVRCNLPVSAITANAEAGAVFSVVEVGPEQGSNSPVPSTEKFLDLTDARAVLDVCDLDTAPMLTSTHEFTVADGFFTAHVFLGEAANQATRDELRATIESFRVTTP